MLPTILQFRAENTTTTTTRANEYTHRVQRHRHSSPQSKRRLRHKNQEIQRDVKQLGSHATEGEERVAAVKQPRDYVAVRKGVRSLVMSPGRAAGGGARNMNEAGVGIGGVLICSPRSPFEEDRGSCCEWNHPRTKIWALFWAFSISFKTKIF